MNEQIKQILTKAELSNIVKDGKVIGYVCDNPAMLAYVGKFYTGQNGKYRISASNSGTGVVLWPTTTTAGSLL